mmetsp:Transcript_1151/g.2445  ORF Transcript_1151/g.2445 Transcript_1151/m.2445 type:complete len:389 (-) Transcript_1151:340-1506(-)
MLGAKRIPIQLIAATTGMGRTKVALINLPVPPHLPHRRPEHTIELGPEQVHQGHPNRIRPRGPLLLCKEGRYNDPVHEHRPLRVVLPRRQRYGGPLSFAVLVISLVIVGLGKRESQPLRRFGHVRLQIEGGPRQDIHVSVPKRSPSILKGIKHLKCVGYSRLARKDGGRQGPAEIPVQSALAESDIRFTALLFLLLGRSADQTAPQRPPRQHRFQGPPRGRSRPRVLGRTEREGVYEAGVPRVDAVDVVPGDEGLQVAVVHLPVVPHRLDCIYEHVPQVVAKGCGGTERVCRCTGDAAPLGLEQTLHHPEDEVGPKGIAVQGRGSEGLLGQLGLPHRVRPFVPILPHQCRGDVEPLAGDDVAGPVPQSRSVRLELPPQYRQFDDVLLG